MLKAVIFDMDGVIIDSEPFHLIVCREIFKNLNIPFYEEEYNTFIGISNTSMWTTLRNKYGLNESVDELSKFQTDGGMKYIKENEISPIPGILDILNELRDNEIKIALASSSSMEVIEIVLDKFKISKYFQEVISGEDLEKGKPAPDIFLKAAKLLQVEPEYCTVIEDSHNGVIAAKAAGMKCIGYQNPSSGNQNLKAADLIIKSLKDLNLNRIKEIFL